jgi:alpha-D-xyloside xylohydrolase
MKKTITLVCFILLGRVIFAQPIIYNGRVKSFDKLQNSIVFALNTGKLKLEFYSESILRVLYSPSGQFSQRKSLSVLDKNWAPVNYTVRDDEEFVEVKTIKISAKVSKKSGAVAFYDAAGKPILKETENGRFVENTKSMADTAFIVYQKWVSSNDEAVYGIGQYQYDIMNWHNGYMLMQQKNTAVAMPFILSSKGYGLFWDNYSLTEYNAELIPLPLKAVDDNNLSLAYKAEETGEYTFVMQKADEEPIEVRMNDSLVYAHYAGVSYPTRIFKVKLEAGKIYNFHVKNISKPINPTVATEYLRPKDGKPGETGLKGEYFDNMKLTGKPAFVRTDKVIDFDWGTGSPQEGFKNDEFSVRWSGKIIGAKNLKNATIDLTTDDGVRLFINGKKVIESWFDRSPMVDSYTMDLEEGKEYDIVIEYYENSGGASARLSWNAQNPLGKTEFSEKVKLSCRTPEMGKTMSFRSQVGDGIDYYFIYGGTADKIISGLRTLTGKAPLYPKWAYGLFMSQFVWDSQEKMQDIIDGYRLRRIPVDVIVQDANYWQIEPKQNLWGSHIFDSDRYPNPKAMIDYLHKKNAHIMISVWPRINKGTDVYDAMNAKNYLLAVQETHKNQSGEGFIIKDESPNAAYDAFNPAARKMYWQFMNDRLFAKGIDGWWMDASEPEWGYDFSKAYTAMGSGNRYLNAYPLMAKKGVYEGQLSTISTKRPYILTRSSFVGQQRYATTVWSGDIGPTWTNFRKSIPAGLNYCLTGMPYWTLDIGGFVPDKFADSPEYPELLVRWYQYGTFLPILRVHGCRKTPFWNYDSLTQNILLKYTNLRYRLIPFIYSLGAKVTNENFTIYRALVMDFASDPKALDIQDQFMFGNEILVCPVTRQHATSRSVYLPQTAGGWFDFWTGENLKEGTTFTANAPLNTIPLFVKAGSIIPMGPFIQYANESKADTLELRVYTGADGHFSLYEDEGDNFNYQKNKFSNIPFTWNEKNQTLTIGRREGSFDGMLKNRTIQVVWIGRNTGVGINYTADKLQTISYSGKTVRVRKK